MPINRSVGKGGRNRPSEVQYVQALLNVPRQRQGQPKLKLDGIVGPKTTSAIVDYQRTRVGLPKPDGRVDPNGPTITTLEAEIQPVSRELKAYATLALALSYDPNFDRPHLTDRELLAMMRVIPKDQV